MYQLDNYIVSVYKHICNDYDQHTLANICEILGIIYQDLRRNVIFQHIITEW